MQALMFSQAAARGLPHSAKFLVSVSSALNKVKEFTLKYFFLLQNICMVGFGVKEFFFDYLPSKWKATDKIKKISEKHLNKIDEINHEFPLIHGLAYIGVGIFGALEAMHHYLWINLGQALPVVNFATNGFFLYGCLYALHQNIKIYIQAKQLAKDEKYHTQARRLQISSALGFSSNVGYIFSIFASIFPPTQAIALALACLAILLGSTKIALDCFA